MRVAILGCGYVGVALARQLSAAGHHPVGVRRSDAGLAAVRDAGVEAVRADVTDADSLAAVPDVDAAVFAASSGGRDAESARRVYVDGLRTAVDAFGTRSDPPAQFVYTSSTGVYGDHGGDWVDESTAPRPTTARTRALAEAERVARERPAEHGMAGRVVRFAGLYGPDRYRIERYLDGPVVEGYVNLLHREDAAGAVRFALTETAEPVLLAVDNEPVARPALAAWLADACGVPRPDVATRSARLDAGADGESARRRLATDKRASNRLLRSLGYAFAYPTFREGYADAVRAVRGT